MNFHLFFFKSLLFIEVEANQNDSRLRKLPNYKNGAVSNVCVCWGESKSVEEMVCSENPMV